MAAPVTVQRYRLVSTDPRAWTASGGRQEGIHHAHAPVVTTVLEILREDFGGIQQRGCRSDSREGVAGVSGDYGNSALTPNAPAAVTRVRSRVRTLAPRLYAMARCRASPAAMTNEPRTDEVRPQRL